MNAPHAQDRGLLAVRRVREVRELDARLGLAQARAEERAAAARLARLEQVLDDGAEQPPVLTGAELVVRRGALLRVGTEVTGSREALASAGRVSDAARAHWQAARTRTRAIDTLLDRRAEARRAEARRAEARELDEIATRAWLRARSGGGGTA